MPITSAPHQYIDRQSGAVVSEPVAGDRFIRWLYEDIGRRKPGLLNALTGQFMTKLLAWFVFSAPFLKNDVDGFAKANGIALDDVLGDSAQLKTRTQLFLRKLDYEKHRPIPSNKGVAVSVADAKLIAFDLREQSSLFIKNRFFDLPEFLGNKNKWVEKFEEGTCLVFRLAPPDYHWFHTPVAGVIEDQYLIDGHYYSVNPRAIRSVSAVLSKNARQVVIIDSDVEGGSGLGSVAVIPVAAQVIGGIALSYCEHLYDDPAQPKPGLRVKPGLPLGYFAPGSSTVVVLFEKGRAEVSPDIVELNRREDLSTLYTADIFGRAVAEVGVRARQEIARAAME
jgi:phosphatidylserine decarboxylase